VFDEDELSPFYANIRSIPSTDSNLRVYIDAAVTVDHWHQDIIGGPELVITDNILRIVKTISHQRPGRAYTECHLGLMPMAIQLMSREAAIKWMEQQDNLERYFVRSSDDITKSKGNPPVFTINVDHLMGW
jgi:hypothetical protein